MLVCLICSSLLVLFLLCDLLGSLLVCGFVLRRKKCFKSLKMMRVQWANLVIQIFREFLFPFSSHDFLAFLYSSWFYCLFGIMFGFSVLCVLCILHVFVDDLFVLGH